LCSSTDKSGDFDVIDFDEVLDGMDNDEFVIVDDEYAEVSSDDTD